MTTGAAMSDGSTRDGGPSPLSAADQVAVAGFLAALAPGLDAVVAVGRGLPDDQVPGPFDPGWS